MERLTKIGKVMPKNSKDIKVSRFALGMEKLDRDAFDPNKAYDKVAATGIKWVRIQSGWQKTEKVKGKYDFAWLDDQVDNLLKRGLKPWLTLCYGNEIYDEFASQCLGAVGCPPIYSKEMYDAWLEYVKQTAAHFKGRIEYYEVWNEPDGKWCWKKGVNFDEYADFALKTGQAVKSADPTAKVMAGSLYDRSLGMLFHMLEMGVGNVADAITFHDYCYDETYIFSRVKAMRALCNAYNPKLEIIQGESGSQSQTGVAGALRGIETTPTMQAKQIARHIMTDILCDVKFTSIFSAVDMNENLSAKAGDVIDTYGYFGMLSAEFDKNTGFAIGEYKEKPAYYVLQNLSSIFAENIKICDLPVLLIPQDSPRFLGRDCTDPTLVLGGIQNEKGAKAVVYWNSTNMLTTREWVSTITLQTAGLGNKISLIDPMDGSIYSIPEDMIEPDGAGIYLLKNIPVKDYPLILTFGDFI